MTRVAVVGIETSHAGLFVPLLREFGAEVVAVMDDVDPASRAARDFASRYGIPRIVEDLAELSGVADQVMLLQLDWDTRRPAAEKLRALGLELILDKPVAGRVGDIRAFHALARDIGGVTGGSALRAAEEARDWLETRAPDRQTTVMVACSGHPFYYGTHAVSLAQAALGPGFVAASALSDDCRVSLLEHASGASVLVKIHASPGQAFRADISHPRGGAVIEPEVPALYRAFVRGTLNDGGGMAMDAAGLGEPELALTAVAWSAAHGSARVELADVPDDFNPWPAEEFAIAYRRGQRAAGKVTR